MGKCPQCGEAVHQDDDFPPWCASCDWNVSPSDQRPVMTYWERQVGEFNRKVGAALLREVLAEKDPEFAHGRQGLSNLLANAISAMVFLFAFVLLAGGLYLALFHWRDPSLMILAALLIVVAVIVRPRLPKMPRSAQPLTAFPKLKGLVDRVADTMNIPHIQKVVITDEFNAFVLQAGIRHEPCLGIGLPLWFILNSQEQVSLIAHELSHIHNGDPARGFFPRSALYALQTWRNVTDTDWREVSFWTLIGGIPFILLGRVLLGIQLVLRLLLFRGQQRAEFLADYREATVAGTESAVSALYKLGYGQYLKRACDKAYFSGDTAGKSLMSQFIAVVDNLPEGERERVRRQMTRELASVDSTHPPTRDRIAYVRHFPAPARLVLSKEDYTAILQELSPLAERTGGRIMDAHGYE